VEPDNVQIPRGVPQRWRSFEAMLGHTEEIRQRLEVVGVPRTNIGWYFRMDPQIAETHGDAAFVAEAYGDQLSEVARVGDVFGIHPHALRWDEREGRWFNDFADAEWPVHCVKTTIDAFERAFGRPPRHHRFGTGFLNEGIVDTLDRAGVEVDLTIEPGTAVLDASNSAEWNPITGSTPGYGRALAKPYRPRRGAFLRAGANGSSRALTMIPMTAAVLGRPRSVWWRTARSIRHGFATPRTPLSMWRTWKSPQDYWDLVERCVASMPRPYFAFSVRTDPSNSPSSGRVRALLEALPDHPLARRLDFVDPRALTAENS
jgi:hypothetical protein